MYAVVITGGKQYRVEAGTELTIERLTADTGSSVTFDRVLFVGDGDTVTVGTPTVDGATVSATVLGEALGPKLRIFKFKQKVKYRRTTGHRQHLTRVRIDEISASGKTVKAEKRSASKAAAPEAPAAKAEPSVAEAVTDAPKPKRTRKPAAKAETAKAETTTEAKADDTEVEAPKPKRTRKPAAPKAKAETEAAPETEE
jgi:large subunit ribosomal protein L21